MKQMTFVASGLNFAPISKIFTFLKMARNSGLIRHETSRKNRTLSEPEHWLLLALAVPDLNLQRERFQRLKVPKSSPFRPETKSETNFSFHQRFQGEISEISSHFAICQIAKPQNQPGSAWDRLKTKKCCF